MIFYMVGFIFERHEYEKDFFSWRWSGNKRGTWNGSVLWKLWCTIISNCQCFYIQRIDVNTDLSIFDVMLPDGSGIDLCEEIKSDVDHKKIPIIIMSAHATRSYISKLSAWWFYSKTFWYWQSAFESTEDYLK